ncbi:MAG: ATP-binding protein [Campylobacterota bacterium]|nr:ATP-binding protein [Campylobacterota bacterium]
MRKIPFYNKIIFKFFIALIVVLTVSFTLSYTVTTNFTSKLINKTIIKEFDNAFNVTENFITYIGQMTQIWADHAVVDNDFADKIYKKDIKNLDHILLAEKKAVSADSIIILDKEGVILSQYGSSYIAGDSLYLLDIVKETFLNKGTVTKIIRERESFIVYSSSLIQDDNKNLGMVLVGYFINDRFLENIKLNSGLDMALVGNSAIMASTMWGGTKPLDRLPLQYIKYNNLLKYPNEFKRITVNESDFIITGRDLSNIESSVTGSLLIAHNAKDIDKAKNEIFYKKINIFGFVFVLTSLILIFILKRLTNSINTLTNSTLKIASGDLNNRVILKNNDELDILAENFNKMIDAVELKNKQLEENNLKLEDEVKKRTQELLEKEKILSQQSKMAAMGEMLENIAHQWRQPLSIISTASTGIKMQKEYGISDEKEEIEALDNITESSQYLSKTIDDFRNFFKTDKKSHPFDPSVVYTKTFNILSSKFKNSGITIIEDISKVEVIGFGSEISQVIMNLLNNAYDILTEKDIDEKLIFVNIYKKYDFAIIEIKDNAGGVPEDIIDSVFDPYFTTKHKAQGTGIGLYMCKQMIENHMKGTIEVVNEEYLYKDKKYKGASFRITLPLIPSE